MREFVFDDMFILCLFIIHAIQITDDKIPIISALRELPDSGFLTRNMDGTLLDISRLLHKEVVTRLHVHIHKHDIEIYPFNHCVMLIYYGKEFGFSKMGSTMGYHTDVKWGKDGTFLTEINSQRMGSLTVVYTVGDSRKIYFHKRLVQNGKWYVCPNEFSNITLTNNSIFILHPHDEKPMLRGEDRDIYQIQNGNVSVTKVLSIGLVFRCVTNIDIFDNQTNKLVLDHDDIEYLNTETTFTNGITGVRNIIYNNVKNKYFQEKIKQHSITFYEKVIEYLTVRMRSET